MARKKIEKYDQAMLKKALQRAAKSSNVAEGWGKDIENMVLAAVAAWIKDKGVVTQGDIKREALAKLKSLSPEMAFAFEQQDNIM